MCVREGNIKATMSGNMICVPRDTGNVVDCLATCTACPVCFLSLPAAVLCTYVLCLSAIVSNH